MKKTIGTITTYRGTEQGHLRGQLLSIVAVIKNAAWTDYDPDADDIYVTEEDDLARCGGVTADDRVEVEVCILREDESVFTTADPRAVELACFEHLTR